MENDSNILLPHRESTRGISETVKLPSWSLSDPGIISTVYQVTTSFITENLADDERLVHEDILVDELNLRDMVVVPILSNQVHGILLVANRRHLLLGPEHREMLLTIGHQVGIAISNANLYQAEYRRADMMHLINQIGAELASLLDLEALFYRAVASVQQTLDYEAVYLMLHRGTELVVRAIANQDGVRLLDDDQYIPVKKGTAIRVIKTSRAYMLRDVSQDSQFNPPEDIDGIHSELAVPIRARNSVIGVLNIFGSRIGEFQESDRRAMETLSTQIGIAIENARLYEETQRRLSEQEIIHRIGQDMHSIMDIPTLADTVVYQLAHALDATSCLFGYYDAPAQTIYLHGLYVSPQAQYPEVIKDFPRQGTLTDYPDFLRNLLENKEMEYLVYPETKAKVKPNSFLTEYKQQVALGMPLVGSEIVLGFTIWLDDRNGAHFDQNQIRLGQTLGNQAATVIERARLHEETNRQLMREKLLRRVAETTNNWADPEVMLDEFLGEVKQALVVNGCVLYKYDAGTFTLNLWKQTSGMIVESLDINVYPAIHGALDDGDHLIVHINSGDEYKQEIKRLKVVGFKTMLFSPLTSQGRLVGALELWDDRETRQFTEQDISLFAALVNQISVALDNTQLITELEERAEQLMEANRLKSEFLANISHELRTPMNSIIGFSDTLVQGVYGDLSDKQRDRLITIKRNAGNLLNIINDLLDISKIEAGHMALEIGPVNVEEQIGFVVLEMEPQISEKSLILERRLDSDLPSAMVDSVRLRQILINLLANAIKFTEEGKIVIQGNVEPINGKEMIHLSVIDTGIGIGEDDLEFIFNEFRQADGSATRRYEGAGLGLAICYKLVKLMEGNIWAESEPGKGSTLHVTLPIVVS